MRDVQSDIDIRNLTIDKVGVKNLRYPIVLSDKAHREQHTVANINMYVNLPHHFRGTHMSRFIEILNEYRREIAISKMGTLVREMKQKLSAESAHLEIEFPYFIEKTAPISGAKALMEYRCRFIGACTDKIRLYMGVNVPVATVCPCSKEISSFGAHNQRAVIKLFVRFKSFLWLEDLIDLVESCGSSPVFSLLKREDEKFVTEQAYQNPAFVEDVVRNVALKLNQMENIPWYRVEVESFESIHNHDAYACIEKNSSQSSI